ncbi:hypothetical protein BJ742DRAFT_781529 [Cladochytrium replicatum]|nr:hypothetical protein BJ742DRAFT_781529 [Cladochytrium replicatum]
MEDPNIPPPSPTVFNGTLPLITSAPIANSTSNGTWVSNYTTTIESVQQTTYLGAALPSGTSTAQGNDIAAFIQSPQGTLTLTIGGAVLLVAFVWLLCWGVVLVNRRKRARADSKKDKGLSAALLDEEAGGAKTLDGDESGGAGGGADDGGNIWAEPAMQTTQPVYFYPEAAATAGTFVMAADTQTYDPNQPFVATTAMVPVTIYQQYGGPATAVYDPQPVVYDPNMSPYAQHQGIYHNAQYYTVAAQSPPQQYVAMQSPQPYPVAPTTYIPMPTQSISDAGTVVAATPPAPGSQTTTPDGTTIAGNTSDPSVSAAGITVSGNSSITPSTAAVAERRASRTNPGMKIPGLTIPVYSAAPATELVDPNSITPPDTNSQRHASLYTTTLASESRQRMASRSRLHDHNNSDADTPGAATSHDAVSSLMRVYDNMTSVAGESVREPTLTPPPSSTATPPSNEQVSSAMEGTSCFEDTVGATRASSPASEGDNNPPSETSRDPTPTPAANANATEWKEPSPGVRRGGWGMPFLPK